MDAGIGIILCIVAMMVADVMATMQRMMPMPASIVSA